MHIQDKSLFNNIEEKGRDIYMLEEGQINLDRTVVCRFSNLNSVYLVLDGYLALRMYVWCGSKSYKVVHFMNMEYDPHKNK